MNENIISPCISICRTDPLTGFCYGCARTDQEKIIWKKHDTLESWKEENIKILKERLSGWQKEAFEKSYISKKKTGLSLLQKKLKEAKA